MYGMCKFWLKCTYCMYQFRLKCTYPSLFCYCVKIKKMYVHPWESARIGKKEIPWSPQSSSAPFILLPKRVSLKALWRLIFSPPESQQSALPLSTFNLFYYSSRDSFSLTVCTIKNRDKRCTYIFLF